jgi:hypothetical protein
MPDLAKKIDSYQPQPDPIAEQIRMLEIQKLQAEIAVLQSQAIENQSEAMLDQARAGTEYAKQGELQSNTDQKNLDFLEQESGLKHAREVEQNGEQAKSNMALAILQAELDKEVQQTKVS